MLASFAATQMRHTSFASAQPHFTKYEATAASQAGPLRQPNDMSRPLDYYERHRNCLSSAF